MDNSGVYSPEPSNDTTDPKAWREAYSRVLSEIYKYFNAAPPYNLDPRGVTRPPCEAIIFDFVSNGGDTLASLFLYASFTGPRGDYSTLLPYLTILLSRSSPSKTSPPTTTREDYKGRVTI